MTDASRLRWGLILSLSGFGLAMGLLTVAWIPFTIEPAFWLIIFGVCAFLIARSGVERPFLHGFLVSLTNCVWMTSSHVIFHATYLQNHPGEAAMLQSMPLPDSPRLMMALTGPAFGIVSGIVLGGLSWILAKALRKK